MTNEQHIENLKKLKSFHNGSYGADIDRAIKALEQDPCEDWCDVPSDEMTLEQARQAVKNLRKKLAESAKPCDDEGTAVKSIATAFQFGMAMGFAKKYDEMDKVMEEVKKAVTPQPKMGRWISLGTQGEIDGQIVRAFTCSECGAISIFRVASGNIVNGDLCPNCGAKMDEPQERSDKE